MQLHKNSNWQLCQLTALIELLTCSSCAALSTWTVATTNSSATVTTGLKAATLSGPLAVSSCCMATSRSSTLQQTNAALLLTAPTH